MLRKILLIAIFTILSGCGSSGDSNSGGGMANEPIVPADDMPADDMPADDLPGDDMPADDQPTEPNDETELTLVCNGGGTTQAGENVIATFIFSQSVNGAATLRYGAENDFGTVENISINDNELAVSRNVPNDIEFGESFSIRLTLDSSGLTAVCSWLVPFQAVIFVP